MPQVLSRCGGFVFMLFALACAHTPAKQAVSTDPEVLTYDAELVEQRLDGAKLSFPYEIKNPALQPVTLTSLRHKLVIDDELEVTGQTAPTLAVAAQANINDKLTLEAALPATEEALSKREGKTNLRYHLYATFVITGPTGTEEYEAEWHGDLYPPQKPVLLVEPHAARYGSSAAKVELSFNLVINNPNPFPIPTEGLSYVLEVADLKLFEGLVAAGEKLAAGADREFELNKTVGDGMDDPNLAAAIKGRPTIPYRFEGTLKAGAFSMHKIIEGSIAFSK